MSGRELTADEVQFLSDLRNNHPRYDAWFRQASECTIPLLGKLYTSGKARFTESEIADFEVVIHPRLFGVVVVRVRKNDRVYRFNVSVSPIGTFVLNVCHKDLPPTDTLEMLLMDAPDFSEIFTDFSHLTDRIYSEHFVLTCQCRCERKVEEGCEEGCEEGDRKEENSEENVEENVEENQDNEDNLANNQDNGGDDQDNVEEENVEGVDLANVEADGLAERRQRISDLFHAVLSYPLIDASATYLATESLKQDPHSFFRWFTEALQIRQHIGRYTRGQPYIFAFLSRWESIRLARRYGVSVIRSCDHNSSLLTVFTPLPDSRIREWWIMYSPEDASFTTGGGEKYHHISELFV